MKAVLLAGGLGTRMREETEFRPKPMVEIGGKPVLWHIMKLLSAQGIKDFVICTGYKSEQIASYFANYSAVNKDFTIRLGDESSIVYHGDHDESDWTVTVAYTGADTMTGGRIKRVQKYVGDEPFLCTYGDGVADVDIRGLQEFHASHGRLATITTTRPYSRFGVIDIAEDGGVATFREKPQTDDWINIGYFILEPAVFDYIEGDATTFENQPLHTLASEGQISAWRHNGFWQPMDTYREYQMLNDLWERGAAPWKVW
ncbi:glucose-1-phosphate cytidylyltransferase [Gryllotalpicola sp.]|uniref:glucose-1-phosphate cytidylyltransferase n=1 Tax=Gryllotalpicola sp. TaxID=1932787 RepID=UPI00260AFA09|nr:glucose-1-phosphate cytidylyltransferase [Gryllotalpicola sp.]